MAKGRKNNTAKNEETSLLKLIKFNQDIIEDNNKTPNVLLDDYVGIVFNECACELVQIKQTTVSEDNIKSTTNLFEDKYKIGDTFQQWITMGWYPTTYLSAVSLYSRLKFQDECSKLKYCRDIGKLIEIQKEINNTLLKFAELNAIPFLINKVSESFEELDSVVNSVEELKTKTKDTTATCDALSEAVKGKYATMVSKGLLNPKEVMHRLALEKD
jgi:hypothetical protein